MATSTLKTRIQHKNGTPEEWSQATNFSPLKGELVVYNDATNPRMKIGDGETNVNELPFINNAFTYDQIIMPDGSRWNGESSEVAVTLNGYSTDNASFYAPGYSGEVGQVLLSSGDKQAPYWTSPNSLWARGMADETWANTAYVGRATTAAISLTQDSKLCWSIERTARNDNSLTAHFYDENGGWAAQSKLLSETNYTDFTVGKDGTGAAGTWNITAISANNLGGNGVSASFTVSDYNDQVYLIGCKNNLNNWGLHKTDLGLAIGYYSDDDGAWLSDEIILDSNNYSSYALPLTGGTVTADLKAKGQFQSQSTSTHQYPGLWFRNNEDADIGAVYMKPSTNNNLNIRWKRDDGGGDGFYYMHCKAADGSVNAPKFVGPLEGNATSATKATQDGNGKVISSTYLPLTGGTLSGQLSGTSLWANQSSGENQCGVTYNGGSLYFWGANTGTAGIWDSNSGSVMSRDSSSGKYNITGNKVYGAVWNDYAEYRSQNETIEPGYITYCDDDGKLKKTTERLQKYEGVVSDTFGFAIGETDDCKTPLAISGRALVYCDPEEEHFHSGDCVCAGPDGLAYRMTREEIIEFPDRIVGVVSEIPTYETWGTGNVEVNDRIWIKVR